MDLFVKTNADNQATQISFLAERLVSNINVFRGISLENAASNAANGVGPTAEAVITPYEFWPDLEPYDNALFAPSIFPSIQNPRYIWNLPVFSGQEEFFAAATRAFQVNTGELVLAQINNAAFADNAFATKFLLFRQNISGTFVKVLPQPIGLEDFLLVSGTPNNPSTGLTEVSPPYNWQNVRFYHTRFLITTPGQYKLVNTYQARNYFLPPEGTVNPATLQFVTDVTLTIIQ